MAAASTLLELTRLQWNPTFSYTQPTHHASTLFFSKPQRKSNLIRLQVVCKYKQSSRSVTDARSDSDPTQIWKNSFDQIVIQIKKVLDSLKKPAVAAVLLGLLLFYDPKCALARSGGRIGGSCFSSGSRSSSSSSSSHSDSSRSLRSSSSSNSDSSWSLSSSSSYRKYSKPRRWRHSFSYYEALLGFPWHKQKDAAVLTKEYRKKEMLVRPDKNRGSPLASESFKKLEVLSDSVKRRDYDEQLKKEDKSVCQTSHASSHQVAPQNSSADEVWFAMILVGLVQLAVVYGFLKARSQDGNRTDYYDKTSVLKLQVGLMGSGRALQQDFNHLAQSADTSTREGLSYVLTEATLALLRQPYYCISCYSSVDVKQSEEEGEHRFDQLSIEERGKFDEETLVNVNSMKRRSSKIRKACDFTNQYIVVTILVAAEGIVKLKPVNGIADLKEALVMLGSIPRNRLMAVEVLWTPQDEKEALSERELLEDYPLLIPF